MALIIALVPENALAPRRVDRIGVVLSAAGVGALVYGIIAGGEHTSWLRPVVVVPIVGGLGALGCLVLVERRSASPVFDLELFRQRLFTIGSVILAISFFVGTGGTFLLSLYLQQLRTFSPVETGLLMLPLAVGSLIAGVRAAQFVSLCGRSRALALCGLGIAASCLYFVLIDKSSSLVLFEVALGVLGLAFGGAFAIGMASAMSVVPMARAGAGSAVANTIRHMGTALGVAVLGSVLGAAYQHAMSGKVQGLSDGAVTSLGSTLRAAASLPEQARVRLVGDAESSFVTGLHAAMWVSVGLGLAATALAFVGVRSRVPAASVEPIPSVPVSGS